MVVASLAGCGSSAPAQEAPAAAEETKAGVDYPTNDMTWDDYDKMARALTDTTPGVEVYGAHYHTWRSTIQLLGILDGKNTIVDGNYDFTKPYYDMVLNQQKDGVCIVYMLAGGSNGVVNKSAMVLVYYIYEEAFRNRKLGSASAAALVLFAIVLVITLIQFRGEKNYAND